MQLNSRQNLYPRVAILCKEQEWFIYSSNIDNHMVCLDPLYQAFRPKNSLGVYKLLQQLCRGMQETSHFEIWCQYSILHYGAAIVWKKKLQSAHLRNIEQRKHKTTYKHQSRLGTMINSKRLRSKTNMSNLCWSTFKIGHQFQ
jgi:hypothetical protein